MPHEKSEHEPRYFPGLGRRWVVIDKSGPNKGITLGPAKGFNSEQEAGAYAKQRSDEYVEGKKQPTSR